MIRISDADIMFTVTMFLGLVMYVIKLFNISYFVVKKKETFKIRTIKLVIIIFKKY